MFELTETIDIQPILLSLKLASITVLILLLICLPLSWWLAHTNARIKILIQTVTALPLVLPPTVLGFYLLLLLGQQGPIGQLWINWFDEPLAFSFKGLIVASVLYTMPFVLQPLQATFSQIDLRTLEASWCMGSSRIKSFFTIVLPQARVGLITAIVLGFAHTIGEFGVVLMVGGNIPSETQVISIAIYEQVETLNYQSAHVLSAGLLIFSFIVLSVVYSTNRRWQMAFN